MEGNIFINTTSATAAAYAAVKDLPDDEKKPQEDLLAGLGAGIGLIQVTNCFEMAQKQEFKLGTGCKIINDFLRGGFLARKIYEIYGESGSGKTQFAIQLLLNSILPQKQGGLGGKSLFVITGKHLNEKRFNEMKEYFLIEHQPAVTEMTVRDNIIMQFCKNIEDYNKIFLNLTQRVQQENIKLVIIDNIHSVCDNFIKADGQIDFVERSKFIQKHSKLLKRLAFQFELTVIILNNVVAEVSLDKGFFDGKKAGGIVPSLGLQWTNCVNERICLKRKGTNADNMKRTIAIEKSSYMKRYEGGLDFEINNMGLKGRH